MPPLTLLGNEKVAFVDFISGNPRVRQRLFDMGFVKGVRIEIIRRIMGTHMIVAVEDKRFALDTRMAHHIHVEYMNCK